MLSKLIWIAVFLLGAVILVEPLRERVRPEVEFALNPIYGWNAKNRVNDLQRVLTRELATGGTLPKPREFTRFIQQREGADAGLDSWGQPFYLTTTKRTYRVGSPGPDRVRGTEDDIMAQPALRPR